VLAHRTTDPKEKLDEVEHRDPAYGDDADRLRGRRNDARATRQWRICRPSPRPLTAGEIDAAVAILKTAGKLPEGAFFPILVLREPPKTEVLAWKPGSSLWREAFAVVMDRPAGRTYEAVVDLASSRVLSWTPVPGVQDAVIEEEFDSVPQIVRKDPRWQAASN
jgi:Cu2+-containing amine oxidase